MLDCSLNSDIKDLAALAEGLPSLVKLQKLHLSFLGCHSLASIECLRPAWPRGLENLHLVFGGCIELRSIDALQGIAELRGLVELHLDCGYCR